MAPSTRHRRPPPPLFTKREITHVGMLVSALLLLAIGSQRIQQPSSWNWFVEPVPTEVGKRNGDHADPPGAKLDGGPAIVEPVTPHPGRQDVALATADDGAQAPGKSNPLGLVQTEECTEVDTVLLARAKDKTPRRAEESESIYQILCVAATKGSGGLANESKKDVLFANLFNAPDEYRGQPVRIEGILRRLVRWDGKELKNAYGIPHFYEGWVFTEDQPHNPIQILFTRLPEGLKPGTELKENVSFDGYFFKLFAYQALDQKWRAAPLLIGYELDWERVPNTSVGPNAVLTLLGIAGVILLASVVIWWQAKRDERMAEQMRLNAGPPPTPEVGFLEASDSDGPNATGDATRGP